MTSEQEITLEQVQEHFPGAAKRFGNDLSKYPTSVIENTKEKVNGSTN